MAPNAANPPSVNGGGSPEAVAYFVSYLVKQGLPLTAIISRVPKTREFTRHSLSSTPTPVSFDEVPAYVLTSKHTFSGREDFAYTAQALKRATIVCEVTGGGANPAGPVDLGNGVISHHSIRPFPELDHQGEPGRKRSAARRGSSCKRRARGRAQKGGSEPRQGDRGGIRRTRVRRSDDSAAGIRDSDAPAGRGLSERTAGLFRHDAGICR